MDRVIGIINDLGMIKNVMSNPAQALSDMIKSNPKYQEFQALPEEAQKYINENGGDAEMAFRKFAQANGVNPDAFIGLVSKFTG